MPDWYSLSQAIICTVGAMALYSLWSRTEEDPAHRDPCWLWLGHAVAIWAFVGLAIFSLGRLGFSAGAINTVRTFASILNSAFLLLAVAYFDYGPSKLKLIDANLYASDLDRICKTLLIRRSFLFENDHHNGYRLRILPHNIRLPAPDWLDRDLS